MLPSSRGSLRFPRDGAALECDLVRAARWLGSPSASRQWLAVCSGSLFLLEEGILDLPTVGVCPQMQGIPCPQEDQQLLGGCGQGDSVPPWEGELGCLRGPRHQGSFPGQEAFSLCSLPAASRLETVCIILYLGPGGI